MKVKLGFYRAIGFLLFCLPAIKPYSVRVSRFDNMYDAWGVLSVTVLILLWVRKCRKKERWAVKLEMLFCFTYLVSTIINRHYGILSEISECAKLLIIPCYFDLASDNNCTARIVHYSRNLFIVVLMVDCMSVFLNLRFGIFENMVYSFLGLDNTAAFAIVPMLIVIFFDDVSRIGKLSKIGIFIYFACTVCKIITESITAMLALVVFGIFLFLHKYMQFIRKLISIKNLLILSALIIIGVVYFNIQELFTPLLVMLGKNGTLSGRINIWRGLISSIHRSPILGFGKVDGDTFREITGLSSWAKQAGHPHNTFLAIIFTCGIIGVIIYIMLFRNMFIQTSKYRKNADMAIIIYGMVAYIILMFTEDYLFQPYFYIIVSIISNYAAINTKKTVRRI